MTTLETMFFGHDNETLAEVEESMKRYTAAREAKVREIAEYVARHITAPDLAEILADQIMAQAEASGTIVGDTVSGEIPGRYTFSGNPIVLSI